MLLVLFNLGIGKSQGNTFGSLRLVFGISGLGIGIGGSVLHGYMIVLF